MHQLGLLRVVRLALVFVAFVVAAAQVFSFLATPSVADAHVPAGAAQGWPVLAALPEVSTLGVVFFDGAASGGVELGAATPAGGAIDAGRAAAGATALR